MPNYTAQPFCIRSSAYGSNPSYLLLTLFGAIPPPGRRGTALQLSTVLPPWPWSRSGVGTGQAELQVVFLDRLVGPTLEHLHLEAFWGRGLDKSTDLFFSNNWLVQRFSLL